MPVPSRPRKNTKRTSKRLPTSQAVAIDGDEQRKALEAIALGDAWQKFETEINGRIANFDDDAPIKQATLRALNMIQGMTFDRL